MPDHDFDRISIDDLRRLGSEKWAKFPEAIGAFIAEMDFGVAPPIARALHRYVDAGSFGYLPPGLVTDLSQGCAAWVRDRYGWAIDPADVKLVPDLIRALELTITSFTHPGSKVILPTPAYMPFLDLPPALGREVVQVPMVDLDGRAGYDLAALDAAFRGGAQLLVLVNPHNPIGRVLEPPEMLAVAEVVERHGGRVFADEIHAPLVYDGRRHTPYASLSEQTAAHTITAVSASKAWNLPGLKCAQVILSNDRDRELWAQVGVLTERGAATPGVVANLAAYTECGPWLDVALAYLQGNRDTLAELVETLLPGTGFRRPEGTYLAWLDFRGTGLDGPADYFLEKAGVAMTDGALCGEAGKGFARFNFALPRPILVQAVQQLAQALP